MQRKNKQPLVSVIIPVFNGTPYLEETVQSVQKSTFRNFEILLIDDGSKDESKILCKTLEKKFKNIRFYAFPRNKGLGRVLNFALRQAQGKLICRLNQDDLMLPYRLKMQTDYFKTHKNTVALGSYIKIFDKNNKTEIIKYLKTDKEIKEIWQIVGPFYDSSVMYKKDVALKAGGYDQDFWPADDTHLFYRLGMRGKLANIPRPLVEVRFHDQAASIKHFRTLALSTYKMHMWADKNLGKAPLPIHLFWFAELIAGILLPPHLNWFVYRIIKKIVNAYEETKFLLTRSLRKNSIAKKVKTQPKRLSLSGVYDK
ncbi:glycosyltransferase family 2 protein [Candidatus Roizmanbacteria bacterium]|nr:glycosyltransferase family 2 protein [Candidatus Roizmanbacteria bacterium]